MKTALIFEQMQDAAPRLMELLSKKKIKVIYVDSLESAITYARRDPIDVIFSQKVGFFQLEKYARSIILLGKPDSETVEKHSLENPISSELLEEILSIALKKKTPSQIIAESAPMKTLLERAKKIAASEASVFIIGESGTGKEVLAQFIHAHSKRLLNPFVRVNCAAITETLLESEFFGHEKGAFTGAHTDRIGRLQKADKGTLLLDEVTEIPLRLQAKLLRAIQEQEFERVGSTAPISVSIRFIATSNRDIYEAIAQNIFREDLFYRLGVVLLSIPPLRERKDDILPLAEYFLENACKKNDLKKHALSPESKQLLLSHFWPGNVRELANVIEQGAVLAEDELLLPEHFPTLRPGKQLLCSYPHEALTLEEVTSLHIQSVLAACNNNKTHAAKKLGISVRTLRNHLKKA